MAPDAYGEFSPLSPARVLDTRTGNGRDGVVGPLGESSSFEVQISGRGGVAASGVSAVVMNVTVTRPTVPSYLVVWPAGYPMADTSNLNYVAGQTVANLVTVAVGDGGRLAVFNRFGTTHVIFDVVGFYADEVGPAGSRFHSLAPARLFDTRFGIGGVDVAPLSPGGTLGFSVLGRGGLPASGVEAVVMNVTITRPTATSYLTVYPGDVALPLASNLNYVPGLTVANLVTVRVPPSGVVRFANAFGSVHVLADVVGFYDEDTATEAGRFIAAVPYRVFDSRDHADGAWGPDETSLVGNFPGFAGLPLGQVEAALLNVTAAAPTEATYLTVFPSDTCTVPLASNINVAANRNAPNAVVTRLEPTDGCAAPDEAETIAIYNFAGRVHVIVDLFGVFTSATSGFSTAEITLSPVVWQIELDSHGAGVHTVAMIANASPLKYGDLWSFGGRLRWSETEVELCNISVRGGGEDFVTVGDIFQTTECGDDLQDAFDNFGLPATACLSIRSWGRVSEYCAPLAQVP